MEERRSSRPSYSAKNLGRVTKMTKMMMRVTIVMIGMMITFMVMIAVSDGYGDDFGGGGG